jgi:hypothetical protein
MVHGHHHPAHRVSVPPDGRASAPQRPARRPRHRPQPASARRRRSTAGRSSAGRAAGRDRRRSHRRPGCPVSVAPRRAAAPPSPPAVALAAPGFCMRPFGRIAGPAPLFHRRLRWPRQSRTPRPLRKPSLPWIPSSLAVRRRAEPASAPQLEIGPTIGPRGSVATNSARISRPCSAARGTTRLGFSAAAAFSAPLWT